jgi:Glycosyl hydrolase family 59
MNSRAQVTAVGVAAALTALVAAIAAALNFGLSSGPDGHPDATIVIDGSRPGPTFQGIGAISGGGGNSRLLIDYPPAQRAQILDYLFKPHYGASLQLLKLEIGGGGYSTDGSEPSVEEQQGQLSCGAGYEFWLARQAMARNPAIKIYGLQWTAPSWVSGGRGQTLWTQADVNYVIDWLRCARANGLNVSYLGGWNERYTSAPWQQAWFIMLRKALDAAGFAGTQIVAADRSPRQSPRSGLPSYYPDITWPVMTGPALVGRGVAASVAAQTPFGLSVDVMGVHDTCGFPTSGYVCESTEAARALSTRLGKPLWESELGATPATTTDPAAPGPGGLARAINNAYDQARITGIIVWPLLDAIPPDLFAENKGLIFADRPWSGYYHVNPLTWVIAQTTQFVPPGWEHVGGANGSLPGDKGGSYDTYQAPDHSAWSMVLQTSVAERAHLLKIHLAGGLPDRRVHVWSTGLRGGGQFVRGRDIAPRSGTFTAEVQPGRVYTFTTTTGQSSAGGRAPGVPAAAPMPPRYTAAPDGAGMANMLAPMDGTFGYVHGVLTQTSVGEPVEWHYPGPSPFPYAVVGWNSWRNYTVSATVSLPAARRGAAPPGAMVIARFTGYSKSTVSQFRGYELAVRSDGTWRITRNGPRAATLATGRVAAARSYRLSLTANGPRITARINGARVAAVNGSAFSQGLAGIGSLGYYPVQYSGFTVH